MEALLNGLIPALVQAITSILTPSMAYIIVGTLGAVQLIKWILVYQIKNPDKLTMWMLVSPSVALPISWASWTDKAMEWWVAGLIASFSSNLIFRYIIKTPLEKTLPKVYNKINFPVDRRKQNKGKIIKERRQG